MLILMSNKNNNHTEHTYAKDRICRQPQFGAFRSERGLHADSQATAHRDAERDVRQGHRGPRQQPRFFHAL